MGDGAVGHGTNTDQQVAVVRCHTNQRVDQFFRFKHVVSVFVAVICKAVADAATRLPLQVLVLRDLVLRRAKIVPQRRLCLLVAPARAFPRLQLFAAQRAQRNVKSIINDAVAARVVVFANNATDFAVSGVRDVAPQHRRPVSGYKLPHVGIRILPVRRGLGDSGLERLVVERPIDAAAVVDAHLHTHILDRSLKITHNVSGQMLAVGRAVGVTYRRGPEGEAVVVLCGEHTVLGPGISNQLCPIPGVPVLEGGIQLRKKILILEVGTVNPSVVLRRRRLGNAHRVVVPLGIGHVRQQVLGRAEGIGTELPLLVSPPRHSIHAKMDEHAQFGPCVPLGHGVQLDARLIVRHVGLAGGVAPVAHRPSSGAGRSRTTNGACCPH
mmetsp:Transcript_54220/g.89496  ORF Transcript_54220/g.89496 Transcript_54220/m.89496 type:complete len:382 (-) Transcript_54220:354-1499(-)